MLVHDWDAAAVPDEWADWLATTDKFGVLAVSNRDPAHAPLVLPTHFAVSDDAVLLHFARPNPIWPHLEAAAQVRLAVVGDYAYIPSYWRTSPDHHAAGAVPTSYYTSVQFVGRPEVVDEPCAKAELLSLQMADAQPEGRHARVSADLPPYKRMLPGIRGVKLHISQVEAKFKYDDHKSPQYRERISRELRIRAAGQDERAARQQERRLRVIGEWGRT